MFFFFFSSRRRHTRLQGDWSSDVCSSDLAGFFRGANSIDQRTGLGADFAAEAETEAAIDARAATGARLRKNGHGRGERMPTEFASRAFKNDATAFDGKRRHG